MAKWLDALGVTGAFFQIGISGSGMRRLRFKSGGNGDLEWTPTASRTLTLPDSSGTIALVSNRKAGFTYTYTGTEGNSVGYLDDYDGKWVYLTLDSFRTIGNASSGAAIAASWTQTLFEHFWTQYTNTQAPLLDSAGSAASRGASATADFNANRRITMPDYRGRAIAGTGTGNGLTARTKGATVGAETHTLTQAELAAHAHSYDRINYVATGGNVTISAGTPWNSASGTTGSTGSGNAHNNMQPTAFEHVLISAGAR